MLMHASSKSANSVMMEEERALVMELLELPIMEELQELILVPVVAEDHILVEVILQQEAAQVVPVFVY